MVIRVQVWNIRYISMKNQNDIHLKNKENEKENEK